ncbi:MazG nucleotide pyrophosphohydrolase domain-containing protein [Ligilactobacillus agilis]|uniref:MazG nucleotide pyrophosphohydrolase domain-containing protein n=1 Tax=Ligilactobacillus agilis TaxID=1601 RepID=UPI000A8B62ED|nr:MazG nucleotide pyrophosphohydrolase domain-containing protein [Ligilactobacillus agilis]
MIKIGKIIKAKFKNKDKESNLIVVELRGYPGSLDLIQLDDGEYIFSGNVGAINQYLNIHCDSWNYYDGDAINALAESKAKQIMSKYVEGIFNSSNRQSYETLARKIINRFTNIGIVSADNAKTQFMKVVEELGELAEGINKDKSEQVKDSLGDVLVTLILLAEDLNLNLLDCLNSAWGEIKDRKGEVKNGSFVKESDLNV